MSLSEEIFRKIYIDLIEKGVKTSPRGQESIEIENYTYDLPPFVRFTSFKSRNFNLDYVKREFLWYLKGDKYDVSISAHAKMWAGLINIDGSINSNYGQYIFKVNPVMIGLEFPTSQFNNVIDQLKADKDSRRASMMILSKDHLLSKTNDVPCTYSINFRIRDNTLNMSVRMRSQDLFYGMANDAPAFSFIHELMLNTLKEFYPELKYGNYHHSVDSAHAYARHFELLEKITGLNMDNSEPVYKPDEYIEITCPKISGPAEANFLIAYKLDEIPEDFKFIRWLTTLN